MRLDHIRSPTLFVSWLPVVLNEEFCLSLCYIWEYLAFRLILVVVFPCFILVGYKLHEQFSVSSNSLPLAASVVCQWLCRPSYAR